jgi:hypothetical protein
MGPDWNCAKVRFTFLPFHKMDFLLKIHFFEWMDDGKKDG